MWIIHFSLYLVLVLVVGFRAKSKSGRHSTKIPGLTLDFQKTCMLIVVSLAEAGSRDIPAMSSSS